LAIAGRLTFNPQTDTITENGKEFKFSPPIGERLPKNGFAKGEDLYLAPPEDGSSIKVIVSENSDRLQLLQPFPKWNGEDFINVPVLIKTKGKCTTDAISPAGPWLKYKGYLMN